MDLAFVFLIVVTGVGVIAYAGMRNPKSRRSSDSGDGGPPTAFDRDSDPGDSSDGGGGDGGGGD